MNRREAGFSFIEILVVMGIIVVLVGMVAVIIPQAQEKSRQTESINNVRNMVQLLTARSTERGWPPYDGKNFHLSLVAYGIVDIRNPDNLQVYFSPGDTLYTLEKATPERYQEVTKANLQAGNDFRELTSYAGRRNADRDYQLTSDRLSMGVPIICDDDDGALHHKDGLVIGYSNGAVKFADFREDLDMAPPQDANNPEPFLGDQAQIDELRGVSSY